MRILKATGNREMPYCGLGRTAKLQRQPILLLICLSVSRWAKNPTEENLTRVIRRGTRWISFV